MGLLDRLLRRGRYAAGTIPPGQEETPPPPPEWSGTAPPEPAGPIAEPDAVGIATGASPAYVSAEDLAASYGWADARVEHLPAVDDVVTHTIATGGDGQHLEIYVCDHRAYPGMARDDEASWRDVGAVQELEAVADAAFVNGDGTVFARVGDDWTIQVLTGKSALAVEQSVELVGRIVGRLHAAGPPS